MDSVIINNWNKTVGPSDTIYHLGDFSMGPKENIFKYCSQLNGYKILIKGNHDRNRGAMLNGGFNEVHNELILTLNKKKIYLSHHPNIVWKEEGVDLALNGHVHCSWSQKDGMFNVGVDVRGFKPVTLKEILNEKY